MSSITDKSLSNQKFPRGTSLISQGKELKSLLILHQGSVLIKSASKLKEDDAGKPVFSNKSLFMVKAPSVIGVGELVNLNPSATSALALDEITLSSYPSTPESVMKIINSKPNVGVLMLRSLYKEIVQCYTKLKTAHELAEKLCHVENSAILAFSVIDPEKFSADETKKINENDKLQVEGRKVLLKFFENTGNISEPLNMNFLRSKHVEIDSYHKSDNVEQAEINYYKRFVSLDANVTLAIAKQDPTFFYLTLQKMAKIQTTLIDEIDGVYLQIHEKISNFIVGEQSWIDKLILAIGFFKENLSSVSHESLFTASTFLTGEIQELLNQSSRLWATKPLADISGELQQLNAFNANTPNTEQVEEEQVATASGSENIDEQLKDSAKKIFHWAGVETEKFVEYQNLMNSFLELKNPLDHEGDARKLRRGLNNIYWELYEKAIFKYLHEKKDLTVLLKMFFHFGFLEDKLVDKEHQLKIYNSISDEKKSSFVFYAIEWLEKIYNREVSTSINDLGLSFFELLRQENRDAPWKREKDLPPDIDTPEARVSFELKSMIQPTARLTSGSIANHFAILGSFQITQSMERAILTKERLSNDISKLLSIDFSAFHREILYETDNEAIKREFIQVKIIPNFIIVPSSGNIVQFWQDREGKNRSSPGRLIAPSLVMADLYSMILAGVGALRWETMKTILGPDWNNISKSSITADYTDYVQFFKKNRDLSVEAKEKLSIELKRFRDDRSRFVNDYTTWVKFESEGTQKFNKVARKVFSKHIPFAKPIREKLLTLPSYTDFIQKSINIRKRKARELEPRYKKYRSLLDGVLPQELEETHSFFNMEI